MTSMSPAARFGGVWSSAAAPAAAATWPTCGAFGVMVPAPLLPLVELVPAVVELVPAVVELVLEELVEVELEELVLPGWPEESLLELVVAPPEPVPPWRPSNEDVSRQLEATAEVRTAPATRRRMEPSLRGPLAPRQTSPGAQGSSWCAIFVCTS
jgi:hypothetical protein